MLSLLVIYLDQIQRSGLRNLSGMCLMLKRRIRFYKLIFYCRFMHKETWRLEKNGLYSVCSGAYREIINNNDAMLQHRVRGNWNKNWNLKLPSKIKNFMWRICWNCLPTPMCLLTNESALQLVPYATTMRKMVNTCSSSEAKVLDAGSGWDFGFQFNRFDHLQFLVLN